MNGHKIPSALAVLVIMTAGLAMIIPADDSEASSVLPEGTTHNIAILSPSKSLTVGYGDYVIFFSSMNYSDIRSTSGLTKIAEWNEYVSTGGYEYYWKFRAVSTGSHEVSFTNYDSGLQVFGHWIIQPSVTTKAFSVTIPKVQVSVDTTALQNISVKVGDSWSWVLVPSVQPPGGWKSETIYGTNGLIITNEANRSILTIADIENSQTKYRISPVDQNYAGAFDFVLTPSNPTVTVTFLEPPSYATAGEQWTYNVSTDPPGALLTYEVTAGNATNVDLSIISDGGNTGKLTGSFAAAGQYTIKITATATGYDPSSKSFNVNVANPSVVTGDITVGSISAYERLGYPGLYDFMATGFANYTNVEWEFGDDSSNDYNITQTEHQFDGSGSWTVRTTFSNSSTSITIETPVLIIDGIPLEEVQYGALYTYTCPVPSAGVITAELPSWLTLSAPFTAAGGQKYVTVSGTPNLPMAEMIDAVYNCKIKVGTEAWESWSVTVKAAETLVPIAKFDAEREGLKVTVTSQALYANLVTYTVYDAVGRFLFSSIGDSHGDAVLMMPDDGTYIIKQTATRYGTDGIKTHWSSIKVDVLKTKSDVTSEDEGKGEEVEPPPDPVYADISIAVIISLIFGGLTILAFYTGRWGLGTAFAFLTLIIVAGSYLVITGEISEIPWIEWRR